MFSFMEPAAGKCHRIFRFQMVSYLGQFTHGKRSGGTSPLKLWRHLENGFKMPQFQLYLVKGDFFHHKASNRIFPLDFLKSAGLTSGPGGQWT